MSVENFWQKFSTDINLKAPFPASLKVKKSKISWAGKKPAKGLGGWAGLKLQNDSGRGIGLNPRHKLNFSSPSLPGLLQEIIKAGLVGVQPLPGGLYPFGYASRGVVNWLHPTTSSPPPGLLQEIIKAGLVGVQPLPGGLYPFGYASRGVVNWLHPTTSSPPPGLLQEIIKAGLVGVQPLPGGLGVSPYNLISPARFVARTFSCNKPGNLFKLFTRF